jgi:hypothetical protein
LTSTDYSSTTTYTYDKSNYLIKEEFKDQSGTNYITTNTYDKKGNKIKIEYKDVTNNYSNTTINTYNDKNKCTKQNIKIQITKKYNNIYIDKNNHLIKEECKGVAIHYTIINHMPKITI